jgi:hypothetical protein
MGEGHDHSGCFLIDFCTLLDRVDAVGKDVNRGWKDASKCAVGQPCWQCRGPYPLEKGQTRLLGVQKVTPWSKNTTAQSSHWFPNPGETRPLSLIGESLNSVQKSDDQNPKVMNSCFHLCIHWKRLSYDVARSAVFRWLVIIILTDFCY